jgi:hypothetical protein
MTITVDRYSLANQIGVDAVFQRDTGDGDAGLQALLDELVFERLG